MIDKLIAFIDFVLSFIGRLWNPVWQFILGFKLDFLIILGGIVVMFALGIALLVHQLRHSRDAYKRFEQLIGKIPTGMFYCVIISKVFYPLIVAWYGFLLTTSGSFSSKQYTFFNFTEWSKMEKILVVIGVLEFLFSSLMCVIRFKPLRLLRYWIYTFDSALIGYSIGRILIILLNTIGENFLGSLLVLGIYYILYVGLPWIMIITTFAPVYSAIALILCPIFGFIKGFRFDLEMPDGNVYTVNFLLLISDMLLP